MAVVRLPSVVVDNVVDDFLDAVAGTVLSGNAEPFSITDGQTIEVEVDGGSSQLIAFNDVDFDDIDAATAAEVVAVLNASLIGATAVAESGAVRITTLTMGAGGSVEIIDEPEVQGGGAPSFDFTAGAHAGADATTQALLINRLPEPDEDEVPVDAAIEFEIYNAGGAAPASADVTVTIDGVLVLSAGSALAGWAVAFSLPDASTRRVVLTPAADFGSDAVVDVDVAAPSVGLSEVYSFTTADTTAPSTLSAVARAKDRIRVTFSEPVRQLSTTGTNDALNPGNYFVDRTTRPAVAVVVESVEPVSATVVDLVIDTEMTFGAGYRLTVGPIVDVVGNLHVLAPNNFVEFTGFLPAFPAGRRFLLQDFIPTMNFGEDSTGDLRLFLAIIQEVTNVLLCDIDEWSNILDPDIAPAEFVDAMLADLGNPFTFDITETDKRRLLRVLVELYQLKGTAPGVIAAIQFFTGITVTIERYVGTGWELTQTGADPSIGDELSDLADGDPPATLGPDRAGLYSFRAISPVELTDEQRETIQILAEYMKAAHEHFLGAVDPTPEQVIDHLELGLSELGGAAAPGNWTLHEGDLAVDGAIEVGGILIEVGGLLVTL